ncbi:MAG: AAA domain-containing protein [Alphaproteobacteria bacterium]|jgi:DNA-binding NtrC family response regulator|nr:AAA domain-containing protein [Alphaproteobacteria bacterium]
MRLMIVGTLEGHTSTAWKIAVDRGAAVAHAPTVDDALKALRAGRGADLLMVDARLPVSRLRQNLESERIHIPIVACGIGNDARAAVRAIQGGAKEYIPLPPDADLIAAVLAAVAGDSDTIICRDPAMLRVLALAEQVAPADASVLITGESGTGKELLARFLHSHSRRASRAFVSVNCAAIPENLLESELFGHEKGAFTGAVARRIGKFEEANGGTLLLDEISEMHPRLQAKLLRAIQEREIDRVGGMHPVKIDIRLLATSNRELEEEVKAGNFREDLFFRLNVMTLHVPALRERPQDIALLAEHFARHFADVNALPQRRLKAEVIARLETHHWRGNVRELENTIHRAVLLAPGPEIGPEAIVLSGPSLAPDDAPARAVQAAEAVAAGQAAGGLVGRTVAEVERQLIIDTLHHTLGNRTHAANILGISIRTLRNKLKQYNEDGFAVPQPGEPEQVSL